MDGVDAALVEVEDVALVEVETEARLRPCLRAFATYPYDDELRRALRRCAASGGLADVARLDMAVGESFAEAALALLEEAAVEPDRLLCIGSHGQTLLHLPEPARAGGRDVRASLQVGEPAVIAARTGVTTVADFRRRDLAEGGQGAPLVPLLDHRLLTDERRGRVALNLGGIANVTGLPPAARLEDVLAFDSGPANVLLDEAARRRGLDGWDEGGSLALAGSVDEGLLARLLEHEFYRRPPPKSADLGDFLGAYAEACWEAEELSLADLLRTLAELTAATVADAIGGWVAPRQPVDEVVVSGGGAHNAAVTGALQRRLEGPTVVPFEDVAGFPGDAKEAVAFALLAVETLAGRTGNVPSATGARRAAVLGKIVLP